MTQIRSPLRAFVRSPLRARATNPVGRFVFQFLTCEVDAHNSDGTPWGWSTHPGQDVNAAWPDSMGAEFWSPAPVPGDGATQEFWRAAIQPFPQPNNPFLKRAENPIQN